MGSVMKKLLSTEKRPLVEPSKADFLAALDEVASLIKAQGTVIEKGRDLASLTPKDSEVLNRAKQGYVEVLTYNNDNFVIFSADQIVALARVIDVMTKRTMGELYPNLPFLPDSDDRPRYSALPDTVEHLRYRATD